MLVEVAVVVIGFLLVEFALVEAPRDAKHEFLLEHLHVLVLCEASLVCDWLPTFCREGLRPLPLTSTWLAPKPLLTLPLFNPRQSVARYM
jgi:hypothetical protein